MSPTTKTSGWPGTVRSGSTCDPTRAVGLGTGLLGDLPAQRAGLHAGRPHLGEGLDARRRAVGLGDGDAGGVDVGDLGAQAHVDPHLGEPSPGRAAQPLAEGGQHGVDRVDEDDPGLGRVDPAEVVAAACGWRSSAIWPAISTPVGPAPTTTKVSARSASAGVRASSASSKAPKMRPRSSSASSIDFIPGAWRGELVVAEPRLPGAGGDEQAVVGRSRSRARAPARSPCAASRSTWVTVPSTTRAFFWRASTSRVLGAISPSDRMPVATW